MEISRKGLSQVPNIKPVFESGHFASGLAQPVAMGALSKEQLYAELKRGYDDCVAGRTIPASDAFRALDAQLGL